MDAEANACRTPTSEDNGKTTFCFFSLNNPKEFHELKKQYQGEGVEIKEFYGTDLAGKSVAEQFKGMLQSSECDSLVISGHHTGYFTGEQSINKKSGSQVLDLDFMEEMSCEEGCGEWFSNVKSLFLMGCQTVKTAGNLENDSDSPDSETIRISSEDKVGSNYIHRLVNQAYSSTLDQNNRLSHRYLRMFPNSSLYGWGEKSPTAGSQHSLPNFINLVGKLQGKDREKGSQPSKEDDILQFIDFMNQPDVMDRRCLADKWTKHWVSRNPEVSDEAVFNSTQATACYLEDQTQFVSSQKLGCDLTQALKNNDGNRIKTAVKNILEAGTKQNGAINEEVRKEAIRANFNRLMSLVTNRENKKQDWYNEVVEQLKRNKALESVLMEDIESNQVGFVRKSDYLYFYREMGWADEDKDKKISAAFLKQLQTAFTGIEEESKNNNEYVTKSFHLSLLDSITDNDLQKWLYENNSEEFDNLLKQYSNTYSASVDGDGDDLKYYINTTIKYLKESI